MSEFYEELDRREAEHRQRLVADRPDNLHNYQGCKREAALNHSCFSCDGKGCILCDYTGHN